MVLSFEQIRLSRKQNIGSLFDVARDTMQTYAVLGDTGPFDSVSPLPKQVILRVRTALQSLVILAPKLEKSNIQKLVLEEPDENSDSLLSLWTQLHGCYNSLHSVTFRRPIPFFVPRTAFPEAFIGLKHLELENAILPMDLLANLALHSLTLRHCDASHLVLYHPLELLHLCNQRYFPVLQSQHLQVVRFSCYAQSWTNQWLHDMRDVPAIELKNMACDMEFPFNLSVAVQECRPFQTLIRAAACTSLSIQSLACLPDPTQLTNLKYLLLYESMDTTVVIPDIPSLQYLHVAQDPLHTASVSVEGSTILPFAKFENATITQIFRPATKIVLLNSDLQLYVDNNPDIITVNSEVV
jgi:hypothetical protein